MRRRMRAHTNPFRDPLDTRTWLAETKHHKKVWDMAESGKIVEIITRPMVGEDEAEAIVDAGATMFAEEEASKTGDQTAIRSRPRTIAIMVTLSRR
jgi:hypothetical protein